MLLRIYRLILNVAENSAVNVWFTTPFDVSVYTFNEMLYPTPRRNSALSIPLWWIISISFRILLSISCTDRFVFECHGRPWSERDHELAFFLLHNAKKRKIEGCDVGVMNQTLTEDRGASPLICCSSSECHPPCVILHSTCSWVLKGFFYSKRLVRENCTMPDKCRTFTLWYAKNVKPLYGTRLALLVLAVMGHKLALAEIKQAEIRLAVMRD